MNGLHRDCNVSPLTRHVMGKHVVTYHGVLPLQKHTALQALSSYEMLHAKQLCWACAQGLCGKALRHTARSASGAAHFCLADTCV